jgi:SAM-dependent methyltransferase
MELAMGERVSTQPAVERLIAVGYGLTYDAIVRGFTPYQALLDEIAALVERGSASGPPAATRVLDVSCGIGTAAERLARRGWSVVGLDSVGHLVTVARRTHRDSGLSLSFQHVDVSRDALPGAGTYDVVVSMHTLYWHPDPAGFLAACRRALKPGGHAVFLTYGRPARVLRTFAEVRAASGLWEACRSLRWLLPTALFDLFRGVRPRYLSRDEFSEELRTAGFEVLETRETFLAGISLLAWARAAAPRDGSCA